MKNTISLLLLVASIGGLLSAQEDPLARGRTLFGEKNYAEAVKAFTQAVTDSPQNGSAWFWLGIGKYWVGSYRESIQALQRADGLGVNVPFSRFAVARCYARMKDRDQSFLWLEKAAEAGFGGMTQLESDTAFADLLSDPRMKDVREKIDQNANPTQYDPRYRQLDFWVGEWDVFNPAGTKVGTNTITKELGGAMLLERWTNAFGNQGASINFFDPGSGKFKQQWIAQSGYNTAYEGELVNGSMVMVGVNVLRDGTKSTNRMTFTPNPDGSVTQFIETYDDSSGTWNASFRGTYKPRTTGD